MTKKNTIFSNTIDKIPGIRQSLSFQLLTLTLMVVLLTEILIMIPSLANHQHGWLSSRAQAAFLVGIALTDQEFEDLNDGMVEEIFSSANILGVTISVGDRRVQILAPQVENAADRIRHVIDLNNYSFADQIADSWKTMLTGDQDLIQVIGRPNIINDKMIGDIVVSRQDLRNDLRGYAKNILLLSLLISTITALFVYWSLDNLIIKPVQRMRANMSAFQKDPENSQNILHASDRLDEIGETERSLSELELRLNTFLNERRRLAALGAGISKISHDLRNILASAQLMSDRLVASDDPRVRKLSPRLVGALDRAITLSRETLNYGKISEENLNLENIDLNELTENVFDDNASMQVEMINLVPEKSIIKADRTQLYRTITNIVRNAVDAMTPEDLDLQSNINELEDPSPVNSKNKIIVNLIEENEKLILDIADNGPGLPEQAKTFLYEPFKGSYKSGGSGLGVAIAAEVMVAHGGELILKKSDENGATFQLIFPDVKKVS